LRNFKWSILDDCLIWIISLIRHLKFLCCNWNYPFILFVLEVFFCFYMWTEEDKLYHQSLDKKNFRREKIWHGFWVPLGLLFFKVRRFLESGDLQSVMQIFSFWVTYFLQSVMQNILPKFWKWPSYQRRQIESESSTADGIFRCFYPSESSFHQKLLRVKLLLIRALTLWLTFL